MAGAKLQVANIAKRRLGGIKTNLLPSSQFAHYQKNPAGFIKEVLGVRYLTPQQLKILESVNENSKTHVQAAHGVGKTVLSAWLVLYWVFAYEGLCITSSPTHRQTQELLWGELRRAYDKVKKILKGERGQLFVRLTESARAFGFASYSYDSNSFQGVHHSRLLVILDEAAGISQPVWDGAESCVVGEDNRMLTLGNPVTSGSPFEKACARNHIRVPVWEHPNVSWAYEVDEEGIHRLKPAVADEIIDPKTGDIKPQNAWAGWCPRDVIPGAVSIGWIEEARKRGENSAFWQSRVEALFPTDSEQSIIPRSWFLAARARYDTNPKMWDFIAEHSYSRFGLDVGDGGDDHAIARWQGPVLYEAKAYPTKGDRLDNDRATTIAKKALDNNKGRIAVDRNGVGVGVHTNLLVAGYAADGVHWGEQGEDTSIFANLKAEQFWNLREAFRTEDVAIAPLGECEEMLMEDFAAIYYMETSVGKTRIEPKEKTRARLHRSPNVADAVVMAFNGGSESGDFARVGKNARVGANLGDY